MPLNNKQTIKIKTGRKADGIIHNMCKMFDQ